MSRRTSWRAAASRIVAIITVLTAAAGCYRFAPIETDPAAGSSVRVDLTDAGSVSLAPYIGPRVESLDARAMELTDSSLVLSMQRTLGRSGLSTTWSSERFEVPRTAIARVRERRLDRTRTWLMSGLGVVGVLALGEAFGISTGLDGLFGRSGGGVSKQ